MAFSMFLRSPGFTSRALTQAMRMTTQPLACQRAVTSGMPVGSLVLNQAKTPIFNCARNFRTSLVRLAEEKAHDHSKLWVIEKATSALLIPLIPLGLLMPNKLFDSILAILITAHSFWGLEAIAVDYVRASVVGPVLPKVAIALVYIISAATLGGLFYLISHDVGLANSFRQLWAIKSEQKA